MNSLYGSIAPDGLIVDVLLGLGAAAVQQLRVAHRPVPAPLPCQALIATGADVCCADSVVVASLIQLGMTRRRFVYANVPAAGGLNWTGEYLAGLTIVHPSGRPQRNLVIRHVPMLDQSLGPLGYQVLIGRDVLARCLLVYDGTAQRFTLAY